MTPSMYRRNAQYRERRADPWILWSIFNQALNNGAFRVTDQSGTKETRHFTWTCDSYRGHVYDGNDTIGIKDNKIVYHYTHYQFRRKHKTRRTQKKTSINSHGTITILSISITGLYLKAGFPCVARLHNGTSSRRINFAAAFLKCREICVFFLPQVKPAT